MYFRQGAPGRASTTPVETPNRADNGGVKSAHEQEFSSFPSAATPCTNPGARAHRFQKPEARNSTDLYGAAVPHLFRKVIKDRLRKEGKRENKRRLVRGRAKEKM
ncbi:hypothetical protein AMELA_G00110840 [Ameiurus melas]|uniref:Uncharacterized protein n=1 Tax=Ameiurus melas TaxID=219545 RepID=A0A7J6ARV2_AMEME|nr:hypothetical protein AMELA_G00110840 [Ameiurus melas]